jgi:DNA-binding FadR family transcriptional regulator
MAKQDDWVRVTLRIPMDLHAKLVHASANSSMNAEILNRLEHSFDEETRYLYLDARIEKLAKSIEEQHMIIIDLIQDRTKS